MYSKDMFETDPQKLARKDSPDTSQDAAAKLNVSGMEKIVYDTLKASGKPMISDEVRKSVRITHGVDSYSSVTARFKSLHDKGLLSFTGEKRPGDSGRMQRVMTAK